MNQITSRPFVGTNIDRNPMLVVKFRTTRTVSTPHLKGKIEEMDKFVAENTRHQPRPKEERGRVIRESQEYDAQSVLAVIEELRQRGYMFTGMIHKIIPEHIQGGGRKPKIFHAYAFRFELPLQAKLRGEKNPIFDEIKGDLFTLLENLARDRDRNMYNMMAYANPITNGEGRRTGLEWLSINIVDYDAHIAKNPKNGSRSEAWGRKYGRQRA